MTGRFANLYAVWIALLMDSPLRDTDFPRLKHPPLREALIDLRLRDELPDSVLPKFEAPKGFPVSKAIRQGQFQFQVEKDKPIHAHVVTEGEFGWRYENEDGSAVVQFRRNGLGYSVLKNYTSWDVLREAASNAWHGFLAVSGPVQVSRLAARYINGIAIPLGADLDEYLTAAPRIPEPLPQIVTSFIHRVFIPFTEHKATAIVTQTLETPAPAVLDIDVFIECSLDGASAEVWSELEKLRSIKNKIFFSSLTPKALDLYK